MIFDNIEVNWLISSQICTYLPNWSTSIQHANSSPAFFNAHSRHVLCVLYSVLDRDYTTYKMDTHHAMHVALVPIYTNRSLLSAWSNLAPETCFLFRYRFIIAYRTPLQILEFIHITILLKSHFIYWPFRNLVQCMCNNSSQPISTAFI